MIVEIQAFWSTSPLPSGITRDQETLKPKAESHQLHQGNVFRIAVIKIEGDISCLVVVYNALLAHKFVPR